MSRHLVLLDVGNSACKWIARDALGGLRQGRCNPRSVVDELSVALGDALHDATVLVASVAASEVQTLLSDGLSARCGQVWFARSRATLDGLVNSYEAPERLGVDRWLAMLAARRRCRGRVCVVDAGSALTIDLVAHDGCHEGGFIIPGTALMERALFTDTGRVRDSLPASMSIEPGRSTAEAVGHGVLLAQAGAVQLAMTSAGARGARPQLLLCGGGATQLAAVLSVAYEQAPSLVFEGLLRQAALEAPELLLGIPGLMTDDPEDLSAWLAAQP